MGADKFRLLREPTVIGPRSYTWEPETNQTAEYTSSLLKFLSDEMIRLE